MKRSRLLVLFLILLLLAGSIFYFFKINKKKKKPEKPKPAVTQPIETPEPTPSMQELPPEGGPGMPPPPPPASAEPFYPIPGMPAMSPPPQGQPSGPEGIPLAESLPTETQALIQVQLPPEMKLAEGTTTLLEPQIIYGGKGRLNYLWKVVAGPEEKIKFSNPADAKPRITIDNLEDPAEFHLRLSVTDGQTESLADLKIRTFPAKLTFVAKSGGPYLGLQAMGDKWVVARSQKMEIYSADFTPITQFPLEKPITQFYGVMESDGRGAVFVQSPEGPWSVLQRDPAAPGGVTKTELPNQGKNIRRVFPFVLEGQPYIFALLERGIELWNLSDPRHPRLKSTQGTSISDPLFLTHFQRYVYVADEINLHVLDFSSGALLASVPSGGSVTSLAAISSGGKNYLLVGIGKDRTNQGRKDYGLRLFEITETGRLGEEKRLSLKGNVPVEKILVVPQAGRALLRVVGEKGLELRSLEFAGFKEDEVSFAEPITFMALSDIEVGKIGEMPVVAVADGNQLIVLGVKPTSTGFQVSRLKAFPSVFAAAWAQANSDGQRLWVGDEGTLRGGSTALVDGNNLSVLAVNTAPLGTFPADADFSTGAPYQTVLFVAADPKTLSMGQVEGRLGLVAKDPAALKVEVSKEAFGMVTPQGRIRPSGVAGRGIDVGLRIAVTLSRESGNMGGAGLWVADKPGTQSAAAFFESDFHKVGSLLPLQDARDVALSADGKTALVAAGTAGVLSVDLEKKAPVARMSLGSEEWVADRVLLSNKGDMVLVTFIKPATRQAILKTFGFDANRQMQEYGTLTGLQAVRTVEGWRAPVAALTSDDLYLMIPAGRVLQVFNMSDPGNPVKIVETEAESEIRSVSVANRFKDVFLALGSNGLAKFSFGF